MIQDNLDIFIITYNRSKELENTLSNLSFEGCPIKNYNFTILDNASTDDTQQFCEDFVSHHPNFRYIRNKINVGISGNIIKAMEMASRKWLWILCDDDEFDWNYWNEIETALESEEYDIVHTTYSEGFRSEEYSYIINEEAFLPTSIYNTQNIDSDVMQNAHTIAYTLVPHHAIGCKVINQRGKIYVPRNRIVLQGRKNKFNFLRGERSGIFHKLNDYQILAGYIGAYKLIQDDKIRKECCDVLCLGSDFRYSMYWFLDNNPRANLYNLFEIMLTIPHKNKEILVTELFKHGSATAIAFRELFKFILKIYKKYTYTNVFRFIYSKDNTPTHRIYRFLGLKLKIKKSKQKEIKNGK